MGRNAVDGQWCVWSSRPYRCLGHLGGNDLGIVDVEGFDYSWNMDAEWVLDDSDNPDAARAHDLPCGDLCDFEGCPLNGIWTFNVIDQWARQRHAV